MPVFEYKALTADGKTVNGIVDAESPKLARSKLRKQGIFPTDVEEQGERRKVAGGAVVAGPSLLSRDVDLKKYFERVTLQDVAVMSRQMATLVGAGIPIDQSLTVLSQQVENEKLKVIMSQIREKVNEGTSLADAMRQHPKVFNELYVNMVSAGEASGALDLVLNRLADYTESQLALKNKVVGALTYPALMLVVSFALVTFLFVAVIPKIGKLFEDMNATLPLITRILIGASNFVVSFWWLMILAVAGVIYGFRRWSTSEEGKRSYHRIMLKLPIFGRLVRMISISRFASTLSALLKSGVPLLVSMRIVANVVDNVILAQVLADARDNISEGQSIAEPLRRSGEFPPLVTHMIAIGEKTGELESMLQKVADAYENQIQAMVTALTSLLEPLMIMFMGGMVGFIALSIIKPMLELNSAIR